MSEALTGASCVLIRGRAVLIQGPPGIGKSSLALALIDRGAVLVGDDYVTLERRGPGLWASPPPRIAGMMEVRNVGLIELPTGSGPVSLLLRLEPQAPRFIDEAETTAILGCDVPVVALWPDSPVLAIRAEYALKRYGIDQG